MKPIQTFKEVLPREPEEHAPDPCRHFQKWFEGWAKWWPDFEDICPGLTLWLSNEAVWSTKGSLNAAKDDCANVSESVVLVEALLTI